MTYNIRCLIIFFFATLLGCSHSGTSEKKANINDQSNHDDIHPALNPIFFQRLTASASIGSQCTNGVAGSYRCSNIHFKGGLRFNTQASDIWGWSDPITNDDYAILGLTTGTAFIRITDPENPKFIGFLASETSTSSWRDIKVLDHYVFIVSEALKHGLQVLDLNRLSTLNEPTELTTDAHYHGFGGAHNIAINEQTSFAYIVGSNTCNGGLHMIDLIDPLTPEYIGCYGGDGYTHDTQCVIYNGPDVDYLGHELCFSANEDTLSVTDVSEKNAPQNIFSKSYSGAAYSHQGWLSEDQAYFFLGDELDETATGSATKTYIWDLNDLDNPHQNYEYTGTTKAIDHNLYTKGNHIFQANYQAGIQVLRTGNLAIGEVEQVAFFDTYPTSDAPGFNGTWSVYPYFSNGMIITANISGEFFVLEPELTEIPECNDGLDNDGDGKNDFPLDTSCTSLEGPAEN